jgi:hypothetical protein
MAEEKNDLAKWAKSMGVEVDDLKRAMSKYGMDSGDMVNSDKRNLLAKAIENKWSQDEWKGQYKSYSQATNGSADWDWERLLSEYKFSLGVLKEFGKELKPIFKWLAGELQKGETIQNLQEEFDKRLAATKFGSRPPSEIAADMARYGAEKVDFRKNLTNLTREIRRIAKATYGDQMLDQLDEGEARKLALAMVYDNSNFLNGQFEEGEITRRLRPLFNKDMREDRESDTDENTTDVVYGGSAGDLRRQLNAWLSSNGVVMTSKRVDDYVDRMISGEWNLEQIKQEVRNKDFTRQYSAYADLFQQGTDVEDIAMDFRARAAQLLEQNVEAITMDNPLVKQAMGFTVEGKPAAMPMYEFEKQVRKSAEWDKTDQAMEAYTGLGETILRNFGFRG